MTREEIIKFAREAGLCTWEVVPDHEAKKLEHFAGNICIMAAAERDDYETETYKRLYEQRGKALERPCIQCGYQPKKIVAMAQLDQDGSCIHCEDGCPACDARMIEAEQARVDALARSYESGYYAGVNAEREACAAFLETGVDMAGLAGDPVLTKYTFELLTGCAAAIRARWNNER